MLSLKLAYLLLAVPLALASFAPDLAARSSSKKCTQAKRTALAQEYNNIAASGLIADFLHTFNPKVTAAITYTTAAGASKSVQYGNTFNTTETLLQPPVYITKESSPHTYSVFFINFDNPDPSLPASEKLPFLHWQESGVAPCSTAAGNQVQLFISSVPESVQENRYTYLIFREPPGYTPNATATATRIITNIDGLAKSEGLTLVGANYFLEGQEDNVPST